jgi:hypothetical protein
LLGNGHCFGEPGDGVGDAFGAGGPDPAAATAVLKKGWSKVPCIGGVWVPAISLGRFGMDEKMCAWGCEGVCVKVVSAENLGVGGDSGDQTTGTEKVRSDERLGE